MSVSPGYFTASDFAFPAVVSSPPSDRQVTVTAFVYNEQSILEEGVPIQCRVRKIPATITGLVLDNQVRIETSDENGQVQFSGLFKGVTYLFMRGTFAPITVTIPMDATDPYEVPSFIGSP